MDAGENWATIAWLCLETPPKCFPNHPGHVFLQHPRMFMISPLKGNTQGFCETPPKLNVHLGCFMKHHPLEGTLPGSAVKPAHEI